MPVNVYYDGENIYHWNKRTETRDESGLIQKLELMLDNGLIDSHYFVDGTRTKRVVESGTAQVNWNQKIYNFAESGAILTANIDLKNGNEVSRRWDREDQENWFIISDVYTPDGHLMITKTLKDDHSLILKNFHSDYENADILGELSHIRELDRGDLFDWAYKISFYDASGSYVARTRTIFDNGDVEIESFTADQKSEKVMRLDPYDQNDWKVTLTKYNPDGIANLIIKTFDDDRLELTRYQDGTTVHAISRDRDDAYDWKYSRIEYAADGETENLNRVIYDNGDKVVKLYDDSGEKIWNTYNIDVDIAQNTVKRDIKLDKGVEIDIHTDLQGNRTKYFVIDRENTEDWSQISEIYDELGQRVKRERTNDDGKKMTSTFEDGLCQDRLIEDLLDTEDWTSRKDFFDLEENLTQTLFRLDNGQTQTNDFNDARIRVKSVLKDSIDGFLWDTQTYLFDNDTGAVSAKEIRYDDGLLRSFQFDDGSWIEI